MTATQLRPRLRPRPQRSVRRRGVVYGFRTLHPDLDGQVVLGYVGQTVQRVVAREAQHREDQPWSDLIVGAAFVIEAGWWTPEELDAREEFHIRTWRPLFNYDHNLANPLRVPIPEARRQRWARDRAAGRPLWQSPQRAQLGDRVPTSRSLRRRTWSRWPRPWRRRTILAGVWLLLVLLLFAWFASAVSVVSAGIAAVLGASSLYLAAWSGTRSARRRR